MISGSVVEPPPLLPPPSDGTEPLQHEVKTVIFYKTIEAEERSEVALTKLLPKSISTAA